MNKFKVLFLVAVCCFLTYTTTFAQTGKVTTGYGPVEMLDYRSGANEFYQTNYTLNKVNAGVEACVRFSNESWYCRFTAVLRDTISATIYQPINGGRDHQHNWRGYDNVTLNIEE